MGLVATDRGSPQAERCISDLRLILADDLFEEELGKQLRAYVEDHLQGDEVLYSEVFQLLQDRGIISKLNFRAALKL